MRPRSALRPLAALLILCAAPLLWTGAAQKASAEKASAEKAEVPRFEPGPCPFETVAPLDGVDCGALVVYENRDRPAEGTLRLAVAILRSPSDAPAPDPLVLLTGGPGTRSVMSTPGRATSPFWSRYRQQRDLVFFDQRGTGYSEPTFCRAMNVAFAHVLYEGLSPAAARARKVAATRACYETMTARGVDFSRYNSATSARDLDDLRQALGYDAWNLLGASYGTRLALTAMRDRPRGLRSVILDSAQPPSVRTWVERPSNFHRALHRVFDRCAADPGCQAAFPTLEADAYALLDRLEQQPIRVTMSDTTRFPDGQVVIDDTLLLTSLFEGLYNRHFIPLLPLMIQEVAARNEHVIRALADQLSTDPHRVSRGLQMAVQCYEVAPFNPPAMMDSAYAQHPRLAPFSAGLRHNHAICDAWHDVRAGAREGRPVRSDIPTLIFGGAFDPVTPPSDGRRAAKTLPNSTFVEAPALGHIVVPFTACTQELMGTFLDAPSEPLDTGCVDDLPPVSFVTDVAIQGGIYPLAQRIQRGLGVPFAAGMGVMALLLLSGIVAWPVGFGWRRLRGTQEPTPNRRTGRLQRGARWCAGLAALGALVFLAGLVVTLLSAASSNPFVLAFGVPGAAKWLFVLPWVVAALTAAGSALAVGAMRRGWWTPAHRVHYALVVAACIGFVVFVSAYGLW